MDFGIKHRFITTRSLKHLDEQALLEDLEVAPWSVTEMFEDVDDCYQKWCQVFEELIDQHCPLKKTGCQTNKNASFGIMTK